MLRLFRSKWGVDGIDYAFLFLSFLSSFHSCIRNFQTSIHLLHSELKRFAPDTIEVIDQLSSERRDTLLGFLSPLRPPTAMRVLSYFLIQDRQYVRVIVYAHSLIGNADQA